MFLVLQNQERWLWVYGNDGNDDRDYTFGILTIVVIYRVLFLTVPTQKFLSVSSKLRPKKLEYQNCSHPKKNKERKKLKYPNCSHPKKTKKEKS